MFDIRFQSVSKRYLLRRAQARRWGTLPGNELWALSNVTFEVERGEALGIIGHNGAGKTTILRLLSGITAPTKGEILIRGRLGSLVELGAGFHPELSGRENIFLNGSILGMSRSAIARQIDAIIEFAGIRDHIDSPVKKYSSGMYVRLGFAIAAHMEPDILLLDEVLAVGDAAFQLKCLDRIAELRKAERTVVLITHDLAALGRICDRVLLIDQGRLLMSGSPRRVIDEYVTLGPGIETRADTVPVLSRKPAECRSVSFSCGAESSIRTGYPMRARIEYYAAQRVANATFRISVFWPSGYLCAEFSTEIAGRQMDIASGPGVVEFHCAAAPFQPGLYRIDVNIEVNQHVIDGRQRCAILRVDAGKVVLGDFFFHYDYQVLQP